MVAVRYKRIFLRAIFWKSSELKISFFDALKDCAKSAIETSGQDLILTSTSSNGASVSYSLVGEASVIPARLRAELLEEFISLYELIHSKFGTLSDAQVFEMMLSSYGKSKRTCAMGFSNFLKF